MFTAYFTGASSHPEMWMDCLWVCPQPELPRLAGPPDCPPDSWCSTRGIWMLSDSGASGEGILVNLGPGQTKLGDEKWGLAFLGCENLGQVSTQEVCSAQLITDTVCRSESDKSPPWGEPPWEGVLSSKVVPPTPCLDGELRGRRRIWVRPDSQLSKSFLWFPERPLRLYPTVDLLPPPSSLFLPSFLKW